MWEVTGNEGIDIHFTSGFKYATTTSTLLAIKDTYFTALLGGRIPTTRDEEGAIFIDRDGHCFAPILTFLRTREVSIPPNISKKEVMREAKFYLLAPLIELLDASVEDQLPSVKRLKEYTKQYWDQNEASIFKFIDERAAAGDSQMEVRWEKSDADLPVITAQGYLDSRLYLCFHLKNNGDLVRKVIYAQFEKKGFTVNYRDNTISWLSKDEVENFRPLKRRESKSRGEAELEKSSSARQLPVRHERTTST